MRIRFTKITDERHVLEVLRDDGSGESVACETRSYLLHDLLHYAVESEAEIAHGFWGLLAGGKTLTQMNDRTGKAMAAEAPGLLAIEQVVGALTDLTKGRAADEVVAAIRRFKVAQGEEAPAWITAELITRVQERMRALAGHWKATHYRRTMELAWPAPPTPRGH
jgi:hypothetical protein